MEQQWHLNFFVQPLDLLLLIGVALGKTIDVDFVPVEIGHDAFLEGTQLASSECVRLGNHRDNVHLVLQTSHELHVHLTQARNDKEGINLAHTALLSLGCALSNNPFSWP